MNRINRLFIVENKHQAPTSGKRFDVHLVFRDISDEGFLSTLRGGGDCRGIEGNDFEIHGPVALDLGNKTSESLLEAGIEQALNGIMPLLIVNESYPASAGAA